jgi:hypothetical protein
MKLPIIVAVLLFTHFGPACETVRAADRLRFIIETDAGGDPDDEQSLVRFLLYVNEWDVEGIIANRPVVRDGENLNTERTGLGVVRRLLDAYGECHASLVRHDPQYPARDTLWRRTVAGYDDTNDAVNLIIAAVDRDDPRSVWYSDWGTDNGAAGNNMKRALDRVHRERDAEGYARFKSKLRLTSYDMFGDHTTKIAPPFKLWVNTFQPPVDGRRWYHRFSGITAKAGGFDLERDVRNGHGSLGALYPTNTTHVQKEGDTMTFLYLVPTGMNDPDQPTWGGWAGRYGPSENFPGLPYFWANQRDTWNGTTHRDNTLARWAAALQNDFRARMDWCVKPPNEANHPPVVKVGGPLRRTVASGLKVELDASASTDPDGDSLAFAWELYREPGTWNGPLEIEGPAKSRASFVAPAAERPVELHIVLTVTDTGDPPLTRYGRVVTTVTPQRN